MAAPLVEQVIPWVPMRQWVVSVSIPLRYWMVASTELRSQVNQYSMGSTQLRTGLMPRLEAEAEEEIVCRRILPT